MPAVESGAATVGARRTTPPAVRTVDAALDVGVVGFAGWTLVYQICVVARWGTSTAAIVFLALSGCAGWLLLRPGRRRSPSDTSDPQPGSEVSPAWHRPLLILAVTAAVIFGTVHSPWVLVWSPWLLAALGGVAVAPRRTATVSSVDDRYAWPVLAMAAGTAVLARFILRPDSDDAHYVHLSTWIAQHGEFPLRDTLFSDQVYPALYWPPIDSWPAFTGTLSRITGISSPTVVYLIVPPAVAFLAVLALWRLLRAWRVQHAATAVLIALVFLLWNVQTDDDSYRSLANFFLGRIWQGKVVFLCVVVPLLYVYLQRHIERPSRRTTSLLIAGGIAAVGLSTSAMFVVPFLAVAAMLPVATRAPARAAGGAIACAGYPLAAAIVTLALDGHTPDAYVADQIQPERLGRLVLGIGVLASIGLLAALLSWRVIRAPVGRMMLAGATLCCAIAYTPGIGELVYDLTGVGRTQWRLVWILPFGALVGALVTTAASAIGRPVLRRGLVVAAAGALVLTGTPVWSSANRAELSLERWKLDPSASAAAEDIAAVGRPGEVVLVSGKYGVPLAIIDSSVKVVGLRFYTDALTGEHVTERARLIRFVQYNGHPGPRVMKDLQVVGVDLVCLRADPPQRSRDDRDAAHRFLLANGLSTALRTDQISCFRR